MILNISPEERLDLLYRLLLSKDPNAITLFMLHSQPNQFLTFLQSAPFHRKTRISKNDEYIVICSKVGPEDLSSIFIIGLDDNYNFFCHRLPETNVDIDNIDLSLVNIRSMLGFDYHSWEISSEKYAPGITVRVQGDIIFRFIDVFRNETEFFLTLLLYRFRRIYPGIINILNSISDIKKRIRYVSERITDLSSGNISIGLEYALGRYFELIKDYIPHQVKPTKKILRILQANENRVRILLGNHRINIIGVLINSLDPELWSLFRVQDIGDTNRTIVVLRPHYATAYHDEHKTTSIFVPMSIIRIDTLNTSNLQVRRRDIDSWPMSGKINTDKILNIKYLESFGRLFL